MRSELCNFLLTSRHVYGNEIAKGMLVNFDIVADDFPHEGKQGKNIVEGWGSVPNAPYVFQVTLLTREVARVAAR